jgi:hypothetical protein
LTPLAATVVVVVVVVVVSWGNVAIGAVGNRILGDKLGAAIVGCAGRCCRADNSAMTSIPLTHLSPFQLGPLCMSPVGCIATTIGSTGRPRSLLSPWSPTMDNALAYYAWLCVRAGLTFLCGHKPIQYSGVAQNREIRSF